MQSNAQPTEQEYRDAAVEIYDNGSSGSFSDGDITIASGDEPGAKNGEAIVSVGERGAYVAAWVYVSNEDVENT